MAAMSLYVAVRSCKGQGQQDNHTNVFVDGKCGNEQKMNEGYENQFSCRKGMFGIALGQDGQAAGQLLRSVGKHQETLRAQSLTEEQVCASLDEMQTQEGTQLGLFCLHEEQLTLCGIGNLPLFLLRGHSLRRLHEEEEGAFADTGLSFQHKDRLLLCTQEVVDFVQPAMLQTILDGRAEPNQIAGDLVREAAKNGAAKDLTVIVVFCDAVEDLLAKPLPEEDGAQAELRDVLHFNQKMDKKMVGAIAAAAVVLVAVGGITLASVLRSPKTKPVAADSTYLQISTTWEQTTADTATTSQTTQSDTQTAQQTEQRTDRTTRRQTQPQTKATTRRSTAAQTNPTTRPATEQSTHTTAPQNSTTAVDAGE